MWQKGVKLKVRNFCGLISTIVEVTREKLVGGIFCPPSLTGLNGQYSSWAKVEAGVLSASIHGSLLFSICINDLSESLATPTLLCG